MIELQLKLMLRDMLKVLQGINNLLVSNKVILQVELFETRREIIENYLIIKVLKI